MAARRAEALTGQEFLIDLARFDFDLLSRPAGRLNGYTETL